MNKTTTTSCLLAMLLATQIHAEPFTYQGKLDDSAGLQATYDFQFRLLDGSNADTATQVDILQLEDVALANGVFTVELNFTAASFDGTPYWLDISVRPGTSTGIYTRLSPTQPIQATPEAQVSLLSLNAAAGSIDSAAIADGTITAADTDGSLQQRVSGSCATGSSINSIAADGTVGCETDDTGADWSLAGNTLTGTEWLGSTNDQPVEVRVNGLRVLRMQHALDWTLHAPNILAGAEFNEIPATTVYGDPLVGATVAGGGGDPTDTSCGDGTQPCVNRASNDYATVGGGQGNTASGWSSTVAGGNYNTVSGGSSTVAGGNYNTASGNQSTVAGGQSNTASGNLSTVAGGSGNTASGFAATVAGGQSNTASGNQSTVAGGQYNTASMNHSTVAGGNSNTASGLRSTVPGGSQNMAGGDYSFAAGLRAKVRNNDPSSPYYGGDGSGDEGTFIWADSTNTDFISTGPNQFLVRASGGVWFGNNSSVSIPFGSFLATSTGAYLTTGGTWTNSSDKNRKEHFEPVDTDALLEKIAALPIQRWNYKDEDDTVKHIGPTAQDFHAAFGLGQDDKHITTVDADGVALAAVQALLRQLQQARDDNTHQKEYIQRLDTRLAEQQRQLQAQQNEIVQLKSLVNRLLAREEHRPLTSSR